MADYKVVRRYDKRHKVEIAPRYYEVPYEEFTILGCEILHKVKGTEDFSADRLKSLHYYEVKEHRYGDLNKGGYRVWSAIDGYWMSDGKQARTLAELFYGLSRLNGHDLKVIKVF